MRLILAAILFFVAACGEAGSNKEVINIHCMINCGTNQYQYTTIDCNNDNVDYFSEAKIAEDRCYTAFASLGCSEFSCLCSPEKSGFSCE